MGMPCQVNSILKLNAAQGYPASLALNTTYEAVKDGYRIIPIDVPVPLVDADWMAQADIVIHTLTWKNQQTFVQFTVHRLYPTALSMKG